MKALLIPFKDPARGKTRLAELLTQEERRSLAWAMFEDVSRAVTAARLPDSIFLVSAFAPAVDRALSFGWDALVEESQQSESASVDWASQILAGRGFETVMRLPADVPLIRGEDVDRLLSIELEAPAAVLVPSRDGTGTNAILRCPPLLFPSRFGPNSLALHGQEAAEVGVQCGVIENPRIGLDIDEPGDVELFLSLGAGTAAYRVLEGIKMAGRL